MRNLRPILQRIEDGDARAADELLPLVYDELRKVAAARLAQENPGQTLQATALVHEAYLRLVDQENPQAWDGRAHFFAAAAESMRRILIERARKRGRRKHGGGKVRVDLLDEPASLDHTEEILAVDEAIDRLAEEDALAAAVLKLKLYGGLNIDEAGDLLDISRATAYRHWAYARAWVQTDLNREKSPTKTLDT